MSPTPRLAVAKKLNSLHLLQPDGPLLEEDNLIKPRRLHKISEAFVARIVKIILTCGPAGSWNNMSSMRAKQTKSFGVLLSFLPLYSVEHG